MSSGINSIYIFISWRLNIHLQDVCTQMQIFDLKLSLARFSVSVIQQIICEMVWEHEVEVGRFKREGTYLYIQLIPVIT